MTRSVTAFICIALIIFTACKKETPAFKPEGFWRGNAYLFHAGVLNKSNGTARFYFSIPGNDTANALTKADGTYSMTKGKYIGTFEKDGEIYTVESISLSADSFTGLLLAKTTTQAVPFNFYRQ